MSKELEQRIEKLPQWANRYIGKLQRDNAALRVERGKIADGNAKITFWVDFGETHGIPDRATVAFHLEDDVIEFSLGATPSGLNNEVCVRSSQRRLVIVPATSNAVNLSTRRR